VVSFRLAFYNCSNLTTIPNNLFANNTKVMNFSGVFQGCVGLTSIPEDLFDSNVNVTTFDYAFFGCAGIGSGTDLPDWWNDAKYPESEYPQFHLMGDNAVRMFTSCINARNFASVPRSPLVWK
jgi:hypothetical protein